MTVSTYFLFHLVFRDKKKECSEDAHSPVGASKEGERGDRGRVRTSVGAFRVAGSAWHHSGLWSLPDPRRGVCIYRAGRWPTFTGKFRVQTEPGGRPAGGQPSEAVRHLHTAGGGGGGIAAVFGTGSGARDSGGVHNGGSSLGMMLARERTGQEAGGTVWKASFMEVVGSCQGGGHNTRGQHVARIVGLAGGGKAVGSEAGTLEQLLSRQGHLVHKHCRAKEGQNRSDIGDGRDGNHLEHTVKNQEPAALENRSFAQHKKVSVGGPATIGRLQVCNPGFYTVQKI